MRKNKIGAVFLVSVLALAGLGFSYAGFYDDIYVYGSVSTATVTFEVENYSGTWVYKVYGWDVEPDDPTYLFLYCIATFVPEDEILIVRGFREPLASELDAWLDGDGTWMGPVAFAEAYDASPGDDVKDVGMRWWQVFPCVDFTADILIHYTGCIPAKVAISPLTWLVGPDYFDFSEYTTITYLKVDDLGETIPVLPPVQMHYCEYLYIQVTIHLPQINALQGLFGGFTFTVHAQQWNELCEPPSGPKLLNLYDGIVNMWFDYPGAQSTFDAHLSGVPADYDPVDGTYLGWCVDKEHGIYPGPGYVYTMYLMSSYDPMNPWPGNYGYSWPCVNYIINHKGTATQGQIQQAIYYFVNDGYSGVDPVVWGLINDALLFGQTYVPGPGNVLAVLCIASPPAQHGITVQHLFIEVDP